MNVSNYIKVKDGGIDARLDVFFYENDGFMIAFAPALDLMGYGKTVDDAKASFEIVIEDFFEYSLENNTLIKYLEKMGWTRQVKRSAFVSPLPTDMIRRNKRFKDILNHKDFNKQSVPFSC